MIDSIENDGFGACPIRTSVGRSFFLRKIYNLHTNNQSVEVFVINFSHNLLIKFTASPIISSSIILCGPGIILMLYRCTVHSKPLLLKMPKLCIFLLPITQNRRISNSFLCAHEFIYLHFLFTIHNAQGRLNHKCMQ